MERTSQSSPAPSKLADDLTDSELNTLTGIYFANSLEQAMEYTSGRKSVRTQVMP
jgi:hypothetical protein